MQILEKQHCLSPDFAVAKTFASLAKVANNQSRYPRRALDEAPASTAVSYCLPPLRRASAMIFTARRLVVATESHRKSLLLELQAHGLDIGAAIEEGRYMPLVAANTLPMFMVNGMPDPVRFLELLGGLIVTAGRAAKGANRRVSVFGECVHLLWAQGNAEAAIQMEKLGNKVTQIHDVDILCGYSLSGVDVAMESQVFQRICAEHSAVHSL
jgi:hypothetical protein